MAYKHGAYGEITESRVKSARQADVVAAYIGTAPIKGVKVGDYVKPTGKKYATGQTIPQWVKDRKHKVSQIKGNRVLLGHPSGINSWVCPPIL